MTTTQTVIRTSQITRSVKDALASSTVICHDHSRGVVTGSDCMQCPHFKGLQDVVPTAPNIHQQMRGVCAFPLARKLMMIQGKEGVRCPLAEEKIEGAPRYATISTRHCSSCACLNRRTVNAVHCEGPKSIQFQPVNMAYLE